MRICTCGHAETAHANETGYCFADKRNGEPCECNRFDPEPETQEAPAEISENQYIGQEEREQIEKTILRIVGITAQREGEIPDVLVFAITNCERGPQRFLKFELICALWIWAGPDYRMWYEAAGSFEFAGVPGREWRIAL